MVRKKKTIDPSGVVKGSHLTVTTFSDGRTVLEWDDEALQRDVENAIAGLETLVTLTEEKVKKTRKKKEA